MTDRFTSALRDTIKQVRSKISVSHQTASSKQICTQVCSLKQYQQAKRLALYHAVNGEIDLSALWHSAQAHEKRCYFPVLQDDCTLLFLPATSSTPFKINQYGISEPDVSHDLAVDVGELNLMLLPLVAFDVRCTRLGMGAGYYDRTLAQQTKCQLFGVAYQFQRVDFLNPQPWDVPLDAVITEKAIYWR
ncbi:MAG: 5-formyltetrahydrofolate cyclo-ligase [Legionellales bacterium]